MSVLPVDYSTMADHRAARQLQDSTNWAVSIYSSREDWSVLERTIDHALISASGNDATIDVLVNGNRELAGRVATEMALGKHAPVAARLRVWAIALGDKSCAWNQYVHDIAPPAGAYVFLDGYSRVKADAFAKLTHRLVATEGALAVTGLPLAGLSARRVAATFMREGGICGNLYGLKGVAMSEIRRIGFRLPLGLYRTDPTLGAALSFGLNLFPREWRPKDRIVIEPAAQWDLTTLRWWHPSDIRAHFRRADRQAQGDLENAAIRDRYDHRRLPFEELPLTARELVARWMADSPEDASALLSRQPRVRRAWLRLRQARDLSAASIAPELLFDSRPSFFELSTRAA